MNTQQKHEIAIKAAQTADLLLQDLQEVNRADPYWSVIILPEIEKIAALKFSLEQMLAITSETC